MDQPKNAENFFFYNKFCRFKLKSTFAKSMNSFLKSKVMKISGNLQINFLE